MDATKRFHHPVLRRTDTDPEIGEVNEDFKEGLSVVVSPGRSNGKKIIRVDVGTQPKQRAAGFKSLPDQVEDLIGGLRTVEVRLEQLNNVVSTMGIALHQPKPNPGWKWLSAAIVLLIADSVVQAVESSFADQMSTKEKGAIHSTFLIVALIAVMVGMAKNLRTR